MFNDIQQTMLNVQVYNKEYAKINSLKYTQVSKNSV